VRIGVLALQGAFIEHVAMLRQLGVEAMEVRLPEQLEGLDGLIIPGGESTAIGKLAVWHGLLEPIRTLGRDGWPIWGVCAGMIVLARDIGEDEPWLGLMDLSVRRNAFGRQVDSFETDIVVPALETVETDAKSARDASFRAVFIRAPVVEQVGPGVDVLATLDGEAIVAARQGRLLATAFHPELGNDARFHRLFLSMVQEP
jgi:5'-phosphate synthase pdxT subunit